MCDWTPYFDWLWIRRWRFTSFNGRTTTGLKYSPKASGAFSKVKIKIISNDVITLSYVKANILGGLIFYRIILEQTLVSRVQVSLIRKVTCTASYVLWAVVILKYLLYLSAGLSWLFRIEIGSLLPFLLNWLNLHCCTCQTDTLSWLSDDTDWLRMDLLTDGGRMSLETQTKIWKWLWQRQHSGPIVLRAAARMRLPMAEQLPPHQPSNDDAMHKKCFQWLARNCPIRIRFEFRCRHRQFYL